MQIKSDVKRKFLRSEAVKSLISYFSVDDFRAEGFSK